MTAEPPSVVWKRATILLALVGGLWLLTSIAITLKEPWVQAKLQAVVTANLPSSKASRMEWMLSRADAFLAETYLWAPRNLATLFLLSLGIFACSRIHAGNSNAPRFAWLLTFCAFGEMLLFSNPWITFSDKPPGNGLYTEPAWATRLKRETGNGTLHLLDRSDFDFMQLNTPSVYGIRFSDGYETVTPRRVDPAAGASRDSARCAASGISHLLISNEKSPGAIPGWDKILNFDEFVLYKNPAFLGLFHAISASGARVAIQPAFQSPNRREFDLPSGVTTLSLLESFNPGWKYSLAGGTWRPAQETELHGIRIDLENPTEGESTRLRVQYHPAYQPYYSVFISMTAIGLIGFSILRWRQAPQPISHSQG